MNWVGCPLFQWRKGWQKRQRGIGASMEIDMTDWRYALPLIAGMVTFALLRWMLNGRNAQWALDHPNHRSLHQAPVPRTGGIGVMAGVMLAWTVLGIPVLLGGAMLLAMLSLIDDVRGLSVRWRFLGHFCVASIMVWWLPLAVPVFVAVLLVILSASG